MGLLPEDKQKVLRLKAEIEREKEQLKRLEQELMGLQEKLHASEPSAYDIRAAGSITKCLIVNLSIALPYQYRLIYNRQVPPSGSIGHLHQILWVLNPSLYIRKIPLSLPCTY